MSRKSLNNTTMEVKRINTSAQDAVGGVSPVKTTVYTVPCRIRQLNASEVLVGGKDGAVSTHRIYCKKIDIHNKDEVIISKAIYDVNTSNPTSADKGSLEVDVTRRI